MNTRNFLQLKLSMQQIRQACCVATISLAAISCSTTKVSGPSETKDGAPFNPRSVEHIPNATPKHEPLSKYGNPANYEVFGKKYKVMPSAHGYKQKGVASWYGTKFEGRRTSSGEPYDLYEMTAAHKSLPLPTYVKVKNIQNGKEVIVKVNDRGPFVDDRLIDLSYAAAKKLGVYDRGTAHVEVTAIHPTSTSSKQLASNEQSKKSVTQTKPALTPNQASPGKELFVQLGAFKEKSNAENLADQLKNIALEHDMHVKVQPFEHLQSNLYKVQLGPLHSHDQVAKLKDQLIAAQFPTPSLITN